MNRHSPLSLTRLLALLPLIAMVLGVGGMAHAAPVERSRSQATSAFLQGQVFVKPRYALMTRSVRSPRAFMVILDASRSMSWNFAGQGTKDGQDVQCGPTDDSSIRRRHCGASSPWRVAEERRITIAKQALSALIGQLDANDTMRLLAFSTSKIKTNNRWTNGDAAGRAALQQSLLTLGQYQEDPFRTGGEAPTASALYQARQLMAQLPRYAPNNQEYKPIIIVLTDSVANSFLVGNGGWDYNEATDICPQAPFPEDMVACHIGYSNGTPRPITAMVLQADLLKQLAPIYTLALAGVDSAGLRDVASAPSYPYFSEAREPAQVQATLQEILDSTTTVEGSTCVPAGGNTWVWAVDDAHLPDPAGFILPINDQIIGYVFLYDQQGNSLPGGQGQRPIVRDPLAGSSIYTFPNLVPGTYLMRSFLAYKGDDQITRIYDLFFDPHSGTDTESRTIVVTPDSGATADNLYLNLNGSVCPEP